jgi:uncharacterized membrane protein YczE
MVIDCAVVLVSIIISYFAMRRVIGIREGTVITGILVGRIIGTLKKNQCQQLKKKDDLRKIHIDKINI